jgi:hypothetical protein
MSRLLSYVDYFKRKEHWTLNDLELSMIILEALFFRSFHWGDASYGSTTFYSFVEYLDLYCNFYVSLLHTASVQKEMEDSDRRVKNLKVKEPFILHQAKFLPCSNCSYLGGAIQWNHGL